ncbi:MAG: polyhydroxyalkanoic acid system family protein [Croceibacterium sp.]
MEVAIPHTLGKETVRQRLKSRSHTIADGIPGGMADVQTSWPSEDRMAMTITAMGQVIRGHVDVEEQQVLFKLELPPALGFIRPIVEAAIRQQGQVLLAPPTA